MSRERIIANIVIVVTLLLIGFLAGRCTKENVVGTKVEYVQLDPIHDTLIDIKEVEVVRPADTADIISDCVRNGIYSELFPERVVTDTTYITLRDTIEMLYDWASTRRYSNELFDIDTIGKCNINLSIQYNRLDSLSYEFIPLQKRVTVTKERVKMVSPFVGIGATIMPTLDAEAGVFIKEHYGLGARYQYEILEKKHNFGLMVMYKF